MPDITASQDLVIQEHPDTDGIYNVMENETYILQGVSRTNATAFIRGYLYALRETMGICLSVNIVSNRNVVLDTLIPMEHPNG